MLRGDKEIAEVKTDSAKLLAIAVWLVKWPVLGTVPVHMPCCMHAYSLEMLQQFYPKFAWSSSIYRSCFECKGTLIVHIQSMKL